jgi:hypothetical protein
MNAEKCVNEMNEDGVQKVTLYTDQLRQSQLIGDSLQHTGLALIIEASHGLIVA